MRAGRPTAPDPDGDGLHKVGFPGKPVPLRMELMEGGGERLPALSRLVFDGELMGLADVANVYSEPNLDRLHPIGPQLPPGLLLERPKPGVDLADVGGHHRVGPVLAGRAQQQTQGGEDSGVEGNQHACHVEPPGEGGPVQPAGSPEGDEGRPARVGALFDGNPPQRPCHEFLNHFHHPGRHLACVEPQTLAEAGQRSTGSVRLEREVGPEPGGGIDPAEKEIGVGNGRLEPAVPIGGGTRPDAGTARPDSQGAARIDPSETAAPGPDGMNGHRREPARIPGDITLG